MNNDLKVLMNSSTPAEIKYAIPKIAETTHNRLRQALHDIDGVCASFKSRYHDLQPYGRQAVGGPVPRVEPIEVSKLPTMVVGVDSSCIQIAETEEGMIFASRFTAVFSYQGKVVNYVRLGPLINYYHESNMEELVGDNRYLARLALVDPTVGERLLRDRLEYTIQMELARRMHGSVILLDGCIPASNPIDPSESSISLLREASKGDNVVVGISKTSRLRFLTELYPALLDSPHALACLDVHEVFPSRLGGPSSRTFLAKFANDGLVLRTDIGTEQHGAALQVLGRLVRNDIFFHGYPDSLRLAHHLSVFTNADRSSLKALLSDKLSVTELQGVNRRRSMLGTFQTVTKRR